MAAARAEGGEAARVAGTGYYCSRGKDAQGSRSPGRAGCAEMSLADGTFTKTGACLCLCEVVARLLRMTFLYDCGQQCSDRTSPYWLVPARRLRQRQRLAVPRLGSAQQHRSTAGREGAARQHQMGSERAEGDRSPAASRDSVVVGGRPALLERVRRCDPRAGGQRVLFDS
ncbi:hypothetical protein P154DRAFT_571801 [Amniculicola lignicola CBS 123094]|uniref:Uncharacterized protein n=1 Tax=Amniculicola lignicola CBS 123094 TaxID=1392246 RepID=A0A6A5X1Y0_9PLEO|nr:hypothetical protein P154DRAFT_571801 [Amniculicola lignicola CBS 123094]